MKKKLPISFQAQYNQANPMTLQSFLKEQAHLSGRSLSKLFFKGLIEVNGKKAHSGAIIKTGAQIRVYQAKEYTETLQPEALPLEIVYEDQQLLVVNKEALLPVHPSGKITAHTLANRVAYYFQSQGLELKIRPVNRLDHGTSGLIIFAKSATSQAALSVAIQNNQISRIYYAIVKGKPKLTNGTINYPIGNKNGQYCVDPKGRPSITHFKLLQSFQDLSLLELSLETGRTHQIRIHLSAINCPIIGDCQHGVKSALIKRPALHAGKLIFKGTEFPIPTLEKELPPDMQQIISNLTSILD